MNGKRSKLSQLIRCASILTPALIMLFLVNARGAIGNNLVASAKGEFAPVATVTVDCAAGDRLQTALDAARPGDAILVRGVCAENVTVRDEVARITLNGQGSATIHGPNPGAATITVLGRGITVQGFTITGGRQGIIVLRGGSALIDGNTIQESSGQGIFVIRNGHARIVNNTVQLNPNSGISIQENSFARIGFLDLGGPALGNTIRRNGVAGVVVKQTSGASLVGNSISENDGPGVSVSGASHADLAGNRIDGNASDGVTVTGNSFVQLGGGSGILNSQNETAVPNAGFGISVSLNSSASGLRGTLTGLNGVENFDATSTNGVRKKKRN